MIRYDRLPTEQRHPLTRDLDRLPPAKLLDLMNRENVRLARAIDQAKPKIVRGIEAIAKSLKSGGRLFFFGAGTSGRLGVIEAAELPPTFGTPPSLARAVMAGGRKAVFRSQEGAEDDEAKARAAVRAQVRRGDVVVGIAASGVTPFVRGAVSQARAAGAGTILVTCNPGAAKEIRADIVIAPAVGPEILAGSTRLKSGTATKLVLNMLTTAAMVRLGKVYGNRMVDLQPKSRKLRERGVRLVRELTGLPRPAAKKILVRARWSVKTAVLMVRKDLDYAGARRELRRNDGFLGRCLDGE